MSDRLARKVVQLAFAVLFLYPFLVLAYKKITTLGMPTLVGWLLPFDPLLYLTWALRTGAVGLAVTLPLLLVVITLFGGRLFCGWICPLGTLFDLVSGLAVWRGKPRGKLRQPTAAARAVTTHGGNSYLRFWLLAASLGLAFGSLQLAGILDPLVIFNRLSVTAMSDLFTVGSAAFSVYWSVTFLALALLALELWKPRFWCRHLCPQGALLSFFSPLTVLNRKVSPACNNCTLCHRVCPMHAIPAGDYRSTDRADCTLCLDCEPVCPKRAISFGVGNLWRPRWLSRPGTPTTSAGASYSRRAVLGSAAVGLVSLALPPAMKALPRRAIVRPPGALPEDDFVSTCVLCQECVRVCPTSGLQPSLLEAGLGAMGTPYLAPRKGGCLLNRSCPNLCARVCPVGAIQVVDQAKMRVGLAKVERDRCLAWAQGAKCLVCVEACPTDAATPHQGRVFVNPAKCSGCGICEEACPVVDSAIHVTLEQEVRFARGQAPQPPPDGGPLPRSGG